MVPGFAESSGFKTLRSPSLFCFEIFVELFSRISLDKLGQVLFYRCISVLNVFFWRSCIVLSVFIGHFVYRMVAASFCKQ